MEVTTVIKHTEKEIFAKAMEIVFEEIKSNKSNACIGYRVKDGELFLSTYSDDCEKFPYGFNLQQALDFAWGWYEHNQEPQGDDPGAFGDGSSGVAFELSTERCGVGSADWGMFVSIKPIWFYYGK